MLRRSSLNATGQVTVTWRAFTSLLQLPYIRLAAYGSAIDHLRVACILPPFIVQYYPPVTQALRRGFIAQNHIAVILLLQAVQLPEWSYAAHLTKINTQFFPTLSQCGFSIGAHF